MNWQFFLEVLIGGLLAGVMYSLVALGFVLIYKASGVFNFAQGAMVFFAALTFVSLHERGVNFWLAIVITLAVMVVLGIAIERLVLRPLVNQPQITLFMATIGLDVRIGGPLAALLGRAAARSRARDPGRADEVAVRKRQHQHQPVRRVRGGRRRHPRRRAGDVLPDDAHRPRAARRGRRPPGGARGRHSAAADLGDRVDGGGIRGAGGGPHVGCAQRRAVRADLHRAEGAAGADPGRVRVRSRARSSAASSSAPRRSWPRSISDPTSAAASSPGSRTCSRSRSC